MSINVLSAVAVAVAVVAALGARKALLARDQAHVGLVPVGAAAAVSLAMAGALANHGAAVTVSFMPCVGVCAVLAAVDWAAHRLPDRLTLASYPIAAIALTVAACLSARPIVLVSVALGGAMALAWYGVLVFARPGAMGLGDLKLGGVLGLYLGWWGPIAVVAGLALGSLLAGLAAAALWLSRRIDRASPIAYGPWMMVGAWGVIALSASTVGR